MDDEKVDRKVLVDAGWRYFHRWKDSEILFRTGDHFYLCDELVEPMVPPEQLVGEFISEVQRGGEEIGDIIEETLFYIGVKAATLSLVERGILEVVNGDMEDFDPEEEANQLKRSVIFIQMVLDAQEERGG